MRFRPPIVKSNMYSDWGSGFKVLHSTGRYKYSSSETEEPEALFSDPRIKNKLQITDHLKKIITAR